MNSAKPIGSLTWDNGEKYRIANNDDAIAARPARRIMKELLSSCRNPFDIHVNVDFTSILHLRCRNIVSEFFTW